MKIYIIDDKEVEIEKAYRAIQDSGNNEAGEDSRSLDFGDIAHFNHPAFFKNDGEAARDELFRAINKMKNEGGGVITDMMFRLTPSHENDPVPPSGLLVVMHCLAIGVPVVVCTDASEVGGHHATALSWIFDGYVCPADQRGSLPFGWVEDKDWSKAVRLLEEICSKKIKGGRR